MRGYGERLVDGIHNSVREDRETNKPELEGALFGPAELEYDGCMYWVAVDKNENAQMWLGDKWVWMDDQSIWATLIMRAWAKHERNSKSPAINMVVSGPGAVGIRMG